MFLIMLLTQSANPNGVLKFGFIQIVFNVDNSGTNLKHLLSKYLVSLKSNCSPPSFKSTGISLVKYLGSTGYDFFVGKGAKAIRS